MIIVRIGNAFAKEAGLYILLIISTIATASSFQSACGQRKDSGGPTDDKKVLPKAA